MGRRRSKQTKRWRGGTLEHHTGVTIAPDGVRLIKPSKKHTTRKTMSKKGYDNLDTCNIKMQRLQFACNANIQHLQDTCNENIQHLRKKHNSLKKWLKSERIQDQSKLIDSQAKMIEDQEKMIEDQETIIREQAKQIKETHGLDL